MKAFSVYIKGDVVNSLNDVVVVQKSFNIWASVFNLWWALFKRQYFYALIIFLILAFIGRLQDIGFLNDVSNLFLTVFFLFVVGLESGDCIEKGFVRRGYQFKELVYANSAFEAKYQYCRLN